MSSSIALKTSKTEEKIPDKIWNASFISVFIANMLMFMGQQMMNTLVAKYANHLGAAPIIVGLVTSAFAYTALIFKIFAAPAIDTFNKRYILVFAMLIMAASYAGYSFSGSIPVLLASRLLQGAGQAFSATCCLALATDTLPPDRLGTGISYFSLAQVICQSIGPTIGLSLSRTIGYHYTFMIGAVTMCLAAVAASRIRNKHVKSVKRYSISLDSIIAREAILPAVLMFLLCMVYYNITTFLVIYAEERGCGVNIGYFFTVYAVTLLVTRPVIGRFGDKHGLVKIFIPAMFCFALAIAGIWEMCEYFISLVTDLDPQWVEGTGVGDTMTDMIACMIGALALLPSMISFYLRGHADAIMGAVESFCLINLGGTSELER